MIKAFDSTILLWCGHIAAAKPGFTQFVIFLNSCVLLKGDLFMAACFWLWFSNREGREERREIIVTTLAAAFIAIVVGRELATHLPYRVRPIFDPRLHMPVTLADAGAGVRNWSAFPSDHAVLFAAVATGFCFISWPLGLAAHAYWIAVVGLPRIYLGLHHPTDVIGGALIGVAIGWVINWARVRRKISAVAFVWRDAHPASFYAVLFLTLAEIGTMFSDVRSVLSGVALWAGLSK